MILLLLALTATRAAGELVQLNCADNATCVDGLARDFVRSLRENRAVKLFDFLTVEPLGRRDGRSIGNPFSKFFENHAFTIDFSDYALRLLRPEHRSDAIELEVFQERAKDAPEKLKKSRLSKDDDDDDDDDEKTSKRIRRRHKKKVLQALIPMMFGMKSAGAMIFSLAVVTALTLKAYLASKLALAVTVGMAVKKLYESYGHGIGLQNNPYLYSQYPIDFPSASSHAYSVSGMAPHFPSPDMYNPSALASHSHTHEMLQQSDSTAQQSQASPTLQLVNSTRATERWDGYRRRPMYYGPSRATSETYSEFQDYQH